MGIKDNHKEKGGHKDRDAKIDEFKNKIKSPDLRKLMEEQYRLAAESKKKIKNHFEEFHKRTDEDIRRLDREAEDRKKKREEERINREAEAQRKREESARLAAEMKEQERRKTELFNSEFQQLKDGVEQQIVEKKEQAEAESAQILAEAEQKRQESPVVPGEDSESILAEFDGSRDAKLNEEINKITLEMKNRELEAEAQREFDLKRYKETGNADHIGNVIVKLPKIPEIEGAYSLTYDRKGPGFMAAVKERIVPIGVAACIIIATANFAYKKVPAVKTFVDSTISSVKHTETAKTQVATKAPEEKTHEAKASKAQGPSLVKEYREQMQEFITSIPRSIYKNISTVMHRENSDKFEIITRRAYPQDAVSAETINRIVEGIYRETGKKVKIYTNINLGIGSLVKWNGDKAETVWMGEIGCGAPTPKTLSPTGFSKLVEKLVNKPFIVIPAYVRNFAGFKGIPGFHMDENGNSAWVEWDSAGNMLGPLKFRQAKIDSNSKEGFYMLTLGRSCCAPWLADFMTLDAGAERGLTRGPKESTTLGCIYIAYYKTYVYLKDSDEFLKGKFKQQLAEGKFREAREGEKIPLKDGSTGTLRKVALGMPGELRIYDKDGNPVDFKSVDWSKAPKLTYLPIDPDKSVFYQMVNPGELAYTDGCRAMENGKGITISDGRYDRINNLGMEEKVKLVSEELKAQGKNVPIEKVREAVEKAKALNESDLSARYWIVEIIT